MTLIDRLSKLEGPDREVDAEIAMHLLGYTRVNRMEKWPEAKPIWDFYEGEPLNSNGVLIPKFTASVDAAIALAERVFPGWVPSVGQNVHHRYWHATISTVIDGEIVDHSADHPSSGAIALCIALLRAKEASNG